MPNILFLIGNGFDLNLGLNTKYSDVSHIYIEKYTETNDEDIQNFIKELKNNKEKWADFEIAMGKYTENFNSTNKNNYTNIIDSFRDVLINKFKYEETRANYELNTEHIITVFKKSIINFNAYLVPESRQLIHSITTTTLTNINFQYDFITFNYTDILDHCVKLVKKNINSFSVRQLGSNNGQHKITDALGKVLHIHGTLQKDLILGVDNQDQIANEAFREDIDMQWLMKPFVNNELGEHNDKEAIKLIDNSSLICIFGMSVGETDKTWWKRIFNWLLSDTTRHLIIFYYNDKIVESNPRTKIENKKEIKNIFFSTVGDVSDEKRKSCESRIHIPLSNGDMFKLNILSTDKIVTKE